MEKEQEKNLGTTVYGKSITWKHKPTILVTPKSYWPPVPPGIKMEIQDAKDGNLNQRFQLDKESHILT